MAQYTKNGHGYFRALDDEDALLSQDVNARNSTAIRISIHGLRYFTSTVMLTGFTLSIILAVIFRFEETTYTHCGVSSNKAWQDTKGALT